MKVDAMMGLAGQAMNSRQKQDMKKEQAAVDFEKIFARQLVREMTKDSFKMDDNSGVMGHSGNMYRQFVTDALAGELAEQRKLGMADLVTRYWNRQPEEPGEES